MKKLLVMIALFGLPMFALTGCGRSGDSTVIDGGQSEPAMTDTQMADYEEQMRSGAASSSPDGN